MISSIAHICLLAPDLAATQHFYCDVLGFKKRFDFRRGGEVVGFYLEIAERQYIEIFLRGELEPKAPFPISHFCCEVADIDAAIARVRAAGVEISDKLFGPDHSWQAWVTDPAGVRIELHQYTPQSCQLTGADCILN